MKKKLSILIALVMAISLCVAPAAAVGAAVVTAPVLGLNSGYAICDSTGFYVSMNPITKTEASATLLDGKVHLTVTPDTDPGYADAGIVLYIDGSLTLGDLDTLDVSGTGADYYANLWFDVGGDDGFFTLGDAGMMTDTAGDDWGTIADSANGALTMDGSSKIFDQNAVGVDLGQGVNSLDDLKDGLVSDDIDSTTKVAIWIGPSSFGPAMTTDIDVNITINGVPYDLRPNTAVVGMDADTGEEIVAINVSLTSIDFGTVVPGSSSAEKPITVENKGTVPIDVSASVDPIGTVFDHLQLDGKVSIANWKILSLVGGASQGVNAQLVVPREYSAQGEETTTLIFIASPAAN